MEVKLTLAKDLLLSAEFRPAPFSFWCGHGTIVETKMAT
jgi:hypothetical protein